MKPKKKTAAQRAAEDIAAANALFRLDSRRLTREHLETMAWSLWANIRLEARSLDSQRHSTEILVAMERAVSSVQARLEEEIEKHAATRRELKKVKALLAEQTKHAPAKETSVDGESSIPVGESSGPRASE